MLNKKKQIAILINKIDNVAVACGDFLQNENIHVEKKKVILLEDISMAHKIAIYAIKQGDSIIKFGVSIGVATKKIKVGELVHLHNMKSNYIATENNLNSRVCFE